MLLTNDSVLHAVPVAAHRGKNAWEVYGRKVGVGDTGPGGHKTSAFNKVSTIFNNLSTSFNIIQQTFNSGEDEVLGEAGIPYPALAIYGD